MSYIEKIKVTHVPKFKKYTDDVLYYAANIQAKSMSSSKGMPLNSKVREIPTYI